MHKPTFMWRFTLSIAAVFLILSSTGCSGLYIDQANSSQLNDMSYTTLGQGAPTVVFQSGLGDNRHVWQQVLPVIARDHRVFAYDRPGYGASQSTDRARDPCTIAEEERKLLREAGFQPPYLLVGHSLGGLYQFAFAKLYPDEVAGIVLVDATLPMHLQLMQSEAPNSFAVMRVIRNTLFSAVEKRELDESNLCMDRLHLEQALTVPARVLVRTEFKLEESGDFSTMTLRHQNDWLSLVGVDHIQAIGHSGHYIQKDQPQAVIDAIKAFTLKH
ncbi:alpha/beta fold hydrolase [Undibacterium jejuense]|uniref:Alpha/beta fold hydrolase n=1 Tax=Undibacterium jejuense TaxID=1344949 RepID=A0A923HIJ0_9BURK|nr:alpha/beta hydrolase [Undibacterium jejuense]MBC3863058.1 alpha/beta fold hydrolase [Undibacterium jejuense]